MRDSARKTILLAVVVLVVLVVLRLFGLPHTAVAISN